jgi:pilus assembly protein CpaB
VAAEDILDGQRITAEMLEIRSIPETAAAVTAFKDIDEVVGARARFPITAGEQVTPLRLVETAPGRALSFQIPEGKRGFSITVSDESSPSAVLVPGDFVDVLLTIDQELIPVLVEQIDPNTLTPTGQAALTTTGEGNRVVGTLFQNMQVISVGETFVSNGEEYESSTRGSMEEEGGGTGFVILAVDPEQAQILTLARELGTLSMTLRPFGDEEFVPLEPFLEPFIIPLSPPDPATEGESE